MNYQNKYFEYKKITTIKGDASKKSDDGTSKEPEDENKKMPLRVLRGIINRSDCKTVINMLNTSIIKKLFSGRENQSWDYLLSILQNEFARNNINFNINIAENLGRLSQANPNYYNQVHNINPFIACTGIAESKCKEYFLKCLCLKLIKI